MTKKSFSHSGNTPRGFYQKLKTARGRTPSSQRWLRRQLSDPFVQKAQANGYRSRSAYKLLELSEKFPLFRPGQNVLDIGCAPGGWLQVIIGHRPGMVVGIDVLETSKIPGVRLFQGDARDEIFQQQIREACDERIDLVLSDMAAPTCGHAQTDQMNVALLAEIAWDIAESLLLPGGHFVCKVFAGGAEQSLLQRLKENFKRIKHCKPQSSRKESREIYLVALERKSVLI